MIIIDEFVYEYLEDLELGVRNKTKAIELKYIIFFASFLVCLFYFINFLKVELDENNEKNMDNSKKDFIFEK